MRLLEAKHGLHARLYEQGEMGRGTKTPVSPQDVTGGPRRMERNHRGEIMGAQGGCQ